MIKTKLEDLNGNDFLRAAIVGSKEYGIVGLVPRMRRIERLQIAGSAVTALVMVTVLAHILISGPPPVWLLRLLEVLGALAGI
jgi:hypothetical protein